MRLLRALSVVLCLVGCGASVTDHHARSIRRQQERPHPLSANAATSVSATAVIASFARAYINWSARTVAGDMRALAERSVGQARSVMQLAAAETASDYELQRGGIANAGTVESVSPRRGRPGQYVVVTRELTSATATTAYQGLQPGWHVALATVTLRADRQWVVSGWQPES